MAGEGHQQDAETYPAVFVSRRPVFDREGEVFGYAVRFRDKDLTVEEEAPDRAKAVAQLLRTVVARAGLDQKGRRLLLEFSRELLLDNVPFSLPKQRFLVELPHSIQVDVTVLDTVQRLNEKGYTLVMGAFAAQTKYEQYRRLAHFIRVDFQDLTPSGALQVAKSLQGGEARMLAENIPDESRFQLSWVLGAGLFSGAWFSRPVEFSGEAVSMSAMTKFRLLRELSRENYEVATLGKIVSSDPTLSYRLLRYVNSAAFSLSAKVSSLKQAIALLGAQSLKQWLMAVVIADVAPTSRAMELAYCCVQRAQFLELCASASRQAPRDPETMFLVGLFSRLDALMGQDMGELLRKMPIDDEVKSALAGRDNDVRPWLELCFAIERAEWEGLEQLLGSLGLSPQHTAQIYAKSMAGAGDIVGLCETIKKNPAAPEEQGAKDRSAKVQK